MRIAVVDDDRAMRYLLERALGRRGHDVASFGTAEAALEALRAAPADFGALVTDYGLPGATGLELAREVRALRADLPVILVSGYVADDLRRRAEEAGIWRVCTKPVSVLELCDTIEHLLAARG